MGSHKTYNCCYNTEFVNLLRYRLELVTSRMLRGLTEHVKVIRQSLNCLLQVSVRPDFFQVRTICIAVNMLIITEQFSFNCSGQTAICVRSRLTYFHSMYRVQHLYA